MTADSEDTRNFSEIFYKYTNLSGAQKILSTHTLRFARALEMNDPFELYLADLFGMDLDEFFEEAYESYFTTLLNNPEHFAAVTGADAADIIEQAARLRNMSDAERAEKRELLRKMTESHPEHQKIRATLERQCTDLAERFRRYGIFCATKTHSNLLMWSHYAEKHQGAVLGLLPDLSKDSYLRLIEPVVYSSERPYLIERPIKQISEGLPSTPLDAGKRLNDRLLRTKSMEWSYEQELRLTFPEEIKDGESATYNTFYPNELVDVYLGCRMSDDNKGEIIRLAKNLNPDVRIFAARLAKRKFALEFTSVGE